MWNPGTLSSVQFFAAAGIRLILNDNPCFYRLFGGYGATWVAGARVDASFGGLLYGEWYDWNSNDTTDLDNFMGLYGG